jgi:hypothetical protein
MLVARQICPTLIMAAFDNCRNLTADKVKAFPDLRDDLLPNIEQWVTEVTVL